MAKKYRVTLTAEERQELQALVAKGKASARKLAPARVLLQVDESEAKAGRPDEETAAALNISVRTIERVRERFVEQGFTAALLPAPSKRVYARTFDGASEARLIALACGAPPEGKARWTLRLLTEQLVELQVLDTVSRECVRQALKKRTPAALEEDVVHPTKAVGGVCLPPGRCLGGVSSAAESAAPGGVPGRNLPATRG